MKATDKTDLTLEQRARLASSLEVVRSATGSVRGWSQYRQPATGTPKILYLLKHSGKTGRLEQVIHVCRDAPTPP